MYDFFLDIALLRCSPSPPVFPPMPPCHPAAESGLSNVSAERFRIFRAEKTYCVNTGKWYFELEVRSKKIVVTEIKRLMSITEIHQRLSDTNIKLSMKHLPNTSLLWEIFF